MYNSMEDVYKNQSLYLSNSAGCFFLWQSYLEAKNLRQDQENEDIPVSDTQQYNETLFLVISIIWTVFTVSGCSGPFSCVFHHSPHGAPIFHIDVRSSPSVMCTSILNLLQWMVSSYQAQEVVLASI